MERWLPGVAEVQVGLGGGIGEFRGYCAVLVHAALEDKYRSLISEEEAGAVVGIHIVQSELSGALRLKRHLAQREGTVGRGRIIKQGEAILISVGQKRELCEKGSGQGSIIA